MVFLYHGNVKYKVLCEGEGSSGHMIPGRHQAVKMKFADFPQMQEPTVNVKPEKTIMAVQKEQVKTPN